MAIRLALLCSSLCAAALAAEAPRQEPSSDTELAEALRRLDLEYKANLEDLLRRAQINSADAVAVDIRARLAVIAKYRSRGRPRRIKTLTIVGSMKHRAELVVDRNGIRWRDAEWSRPEDLNVNGVPWEPKWHDGPAWSDTLPMDIEEILRWQASGKVSVRKVHRGPGITAFKIINKVEGERSTFTLRVRYRAPVPKKTH